jgi:hypothetical protein
MAQISTIKGPRLPYVVRKLEGTVKVTRYRYNRRIGRIEAYEAEEDGGFLVMFPKGHYLRIRRPEDLVRYQLSKKPRPIAGDGMGMHPSQSLDRSFENMEADVADMVRSRSGPVSVPNFDGKLNLPKRTEEDSYA